MSLVLKRIKVSDFGIFGRIIGSDGNEICVTLEHNYDGIAKVPTGEYQCVRGIHRLENLLPFETFEVMGVPGHTGILFHPGNYNADSKGCILVGTRAEEKMIVASRQAFDHFMDLLKGVDSFRLTVQNEMAG